MGQMETGGEFSQKIRSTVDNLMNEARSHGEPAAEALRNMLSQKSKELHERLEPVKGKIEASIAAQPQLKEYLDKARRTLDDLAQEAKSRGEETSGTLKEVASEKAEELRNLTATGKSAAEGVAAGVTSQLGKAKSAIDEKLGSKKS